METLHASINAIKAIRSSKKRADELTVYKFVKNELHSIINEEINDTLKTLCELEALWLATCTRKPKVPGSIPAAGYVQS